MSEKLVDKPLPSLAEWLGDGTRAEGFEEWVRQALVADADQREAALFRIIQTLSIACMEACRRETTLHGEELSTMITRLARCCGVAIMAPILSILDAGKAPPLLKIARMMAVEFEHGARLISRNTLESKVKEKP